MQGSLNNRVDERGVQTYVVTKTTLKRIESEAEHKSGETSKSVFNQDITAEDQRILETEQFGYSPSKR